jgi:FKBP-type peptidyl-prolyl cis-trans isomerase
MLFSSKRILLAGIALFGLVDVALARSGFSWDELQQIDQKWPQAITTTTGLRYVVLNEGTGPKPKPGEVVKVLFKGMFFDGRVFDQVSDPSKAFSFRLGRGEIIDGWEEGISKMAVGGKCILIVPYYLAYGSRGQPPRIPRQTSLIFEVELLSIEAFHTPEGKTVAKP